MIAHYRDKEPSCANLLISSTKQAIAKVGNWDDAGEMIGAISEFMFEKNWTVLGEIAIGDAIYVTAKHNNHPSYVAGNMQLEDDTNKNQGQK